MLADLVRIDAATRLTLVGLSDGDAAELIRRLTDARDDDAVAALATSVHTLTDGLPFLLCELWRLLVDRGAVEAAGGVPRLTRPLAELSSPERVRDVVHYRLSRLAPPTTEMLELASVVGTQFELPVLEEMLGRNRLVGSLEEALGSGTIEELPGPRLPHRFSHDLVRRALYDRLSGMRRAEFHGRVGEALERIHAGETERVASELAHHFSLAAPLGEVERAVHYNLRAADAATGAFGLEEAAVRLETALALGIADRSTRGRVGLELGRALWILGHQSARPRCSTRPSNPHALRGTSNSSGTCASSARERGASATPTSSRHWRRAAVEVFERLDDDLGLARAHRRIALAESHRCAFGESGTGERAGTCARRRRRRPAGGDAHRRLAVHRFALRARRPLRAASRAAVSCSSRRRAAR